tara:strand:+ start:764 stop:913 length:150 start_codon:yes stop_codon:yes gene_type:complete
MFLKNRLREKYKSRLAEQKAQLKKPWDKIHKEWIKGRILEIELILIELE